MYSVIDFNTMWLDVIDKYYQLFNDVMKVSLSIQSIWSKEYAYRLTLSFIIWINRIIDLYDWVQYMRIVKIVKIVLLNC